jgi:hypothetical protein
MGKAWNGLTLTVRITKGEKGGGRSGVRYEVLLSSLSEPLQRAYLGEAEPDDAGSSIVPYAAPKYFVAALNQGKVEEKRYRVLRLIMETAFGTAERAKAIRDASHHHDVPVRTIQRWVSRCEAHGWHLDALGRK